MTPRCLATSRCPVCGSRDRTPMPWLAQQPLLRCAVCSAVHAASYDDPDDVYRDGYHAGHTGYHLDTTAAAFRDYLDQVIARRLDLVASVARPPGRLLDVGCGEGDLLVAARARGWDVAGVEPVVAAAAAARARNLAVEISTLAEVADVSAAYDVVTASHIVEHVPDVADTLRRLMALVRPGGHLLVEVPNWRSVHRRRAGARWPLLAPGEHITHFTPAVLTTALEEAGGRTVMRRTPSWIGTPQSVSQVAIDLGLPPSRALRLLARSSSGGSSPSRLGWGVLRTVDALWTRLGVGMVIVAIVQAGMVASP